MSAGRRLASAGGEETGAAGGLRLYPGFRRRWGRLLCALWVQAAVAAGAGVAVSAEAGLEVGDPVHDWGRVYRGEVVRHSFALENRGAEPAIVKDIKIHCSCTQVIGDEVKRPIPPGGKVTVLLEIDTTTLTGTVKKDVDLITETGDETRLSMQGEVVEILKLDPPLPKVEQVRGGFLDPAPTRVAVLPREGRADVTLDGVKATRGILRVELEKPEAGREYQISMLPDPKNENQDAFQTEVLELESTVGQKSLVLRVHVSVVLKDRIDVLPSKSVYVPRSATGDFGKPGVTVEKVLELASIGGEKHRFRVKKVESRSGVFAAVVEPIEDGRRYRLKVTLSRGPAAGERFLRDTIEIATDDPLVPRILVPAVAQF